MALILNIDTATPSGSVCLAGDGVPLHTEAMESQKDHATLTIPFIKTMLKAEGVDIRRLDAVAISAGPGSYTGVRVAAATAKGLCYALDIPLIAINTLEMMAAGLSMQMEGEQIWYCPAIDARRMEVYTALYDTALRAVIPPAALVLDDSFLDDYRNQPVYLFGTGRGKAEALYKDRKAWHFPDFTCNAAHLAPLAEQHFVREQFQDLAYFEPFYLKSFYTTASLK